MHVIRPAEVAAVEHHLETGRPLLALPLQTPELDQPLPQDFYEIGVTARVLKVVRLGDSTMRVLLEGLQLACGVARAMERHNGFRKGKQ